MDTKLKLISVKREDLSLRDRKEESMEGSQLGSMKQESRKKAVCTSREVSVVGARKVFSSQVESNGRQSIGSQKGQRRVVCVVAWSFASSSLFQCRAESSLIEARTQPRSVWKETEMRN